MSDLDARIAQFEKMASADPDNDMAHFSLGSAYLQAGRHAEAAKSFERCISFNPEMSKAYQLAGQAMIGAGWADKAVAVLTTGYEVAARKGDRMPQNAMADLLRSIGREPPKVETAPSATLPSSFFHFSRLMSALVRVGSPWRVKAAAICIARSDRPPASSPT